MAVTNIGDVQNQVQKFWAPVFTKELRESLMLGQLVNKDYDGEIKRQGDTVYVSQINAPTGALLTVGTDADAFDSEQLSMTRIAIQANKRAVAAFEFEDLAVLQSQLDAQDSEIRSSLMYAMNQQINDYLYSLVNPSTSAPDHLISGVTDFNASQLSAVRLLAATAKWPKDKPWYVLADPSYFSDLMNATTLVSSDYGASDAPTISGNIALKRFGFNIFEDNSRSTDFALAFYPDWLHMVMQSQVSVKLSDLHAQKKFGYLLSVDVVFGAALGVSGNVKHIKIYNS